MKQFDMQVGAVLESLEVEDKYHGHVSSSCRYLARSYIKESKKGHKNKKGGTKVSQSRKPDNSEQQQQPKSKALTETTMGGGSSSSQSAVAHKARSSDDRFFDATEDLVESDDGSRSPLRRRSFNRAAVIFYDAEEGSEDMEREPPSFKREVGLLPETTAVSSSPTDELSRSKSLQTFVKAQVIISSQESPEYANIDKEVRIGLATLSFYCNRPTLIALMDLGTAITADVEEQPPLEESTQQASGPTSTAGGGYSTDLVSTIDTSVIEDVDEDGIPKVPYERKDSVVKGLLGQGKDRVMFLLVVNMDLAQIVLNSDDGSQLATLSQENLHTEVKLYPASWGIKAALGNLRISDDGVDDGHHPYQYICDMRDPQGTSFIELEIVSFNADDEDYEGYEFSITGKMSELRIVFLNRFIQEVLAYGMGLIPPSSGEVLVKLKDRVTDVEKLFTQSEIEGQPSLKIDLSLMKPIIIMPRSSHSTDFLELDILHINIRSTSDWYGGSKDELGAVRLETMTLEIEDLHLVVGVGGQTGEGIIQEANGFSLVLRRPLRDLWHQVPAADLSVKIEELKAALSDKEYQVITECAISNMAETPNLPPSLFPSKEEATDKINKEKQIVEEESPPPQQLSSNSNVVTNEAHGSSTKETVPEISGSSANPAASLASENAHTTVKIGIGIDLVQLSLFVGGSRDNTLASIQVLIFFHMMKP
jgi:vacuolar protein sorting-associated protein 13A/C